MSDINKETDIYKINEADISHQTESTWENIQEYFETYIDQFTPFKDEPAYKAIVSFIIKYYIDLIYNKQPDIFKDLFENQTIRTDIVDLLLVSIGLPERVIQTITTTSKFIILKSFSDFERYKGTIKFFRSIGGAFSDAMSYYELYIDYDEEYVNPVAQYLLVMDKDNIRPSSYFLISSTLNSYYIWFDFEDAREDPNLENKIGIRIPYSSTSTSVEIAQDIISKMNLTNEFIVNINSTDILEIQLAKHGAPLEPISPGTTTLDMKVVTEGKNDGAWILRPRPIFIHPKTEVVEDVFEYQAAYNKIPTLLVPEEQLENLRQRNEIIIPTKSNIILMDYTQSIDASYFNTLIFTLLMENIGDDSFPLYLTGSDGTTTITYNTAIYLWYYLLAKYYNVTLEGISLMNHIVMGTNKHSSEFTVADIPEIQKAYDNIKTRNDMIEFYNEYIDRQYSRFFESDKPTVEQMSETLRKIDTEFWEYIERRLAEAENQEQDIRFLLDEVYASLSLSFSQYLDDRNPVNSIIYEYIPIILQFITQVTTNIRATDSYKIVYNLKPFHTELLDLAHNKIVIENKFNALLFEDQYLTLYILVLADLLHMADQTIFSFTPNGKDSLSLNDEFVSNIRLGYNFLISPIDECITLFKQTMLSMMHLTEQSDFLCSIEKNMKLGVVDGKHVNAVMPEKMNLTPKDKVNARFLGFLKTLVSTLEKLGFRFKEESGWVNLATDSATQDILVNKSENRYLFVDHILKRMHESLVEYPYMFNERNSFLFSPKNEELDILSNISDSTLIHQNSDILLNDEISIK